MNRKQLPDPQPAGAMTRFEPSHLSVHSPPAEDSSTNLLADIWLRRWMVLFTAIVFAAGAVVFLKVVPPAYTANAGLLVQPPQSATGTTGAVAVATGVPDSYYFTVIAVIQSPAVCDQAARILQPTANDAEISNLSRLIQANLNTDVGRRDNIVTISYTDKTPAEAARVCSAITQAYIKYQTSSRSGSRREMLGAMKAEKDKFEKQLADGRQREVDFKRLHPEVQATTPNGGNSETQELTKLQDARTTARLAMVDALAVEATAEKVKGDPAKLQMLANSQKYVTAYDAEIARTSQLLSDAQTRLTFLGQTYPSGHPLVISNKKVVDELTAKLQVLQQEYVKNYLDAVHQASIEASDKVEQIQKEIDQVQQRVGNLTSIEGEYQKLDNEVQSNVALVASLNQQINSLEVTDNTEVPNISVLRPAVLEEAVRSPSPARVLVLALAMGLVFGSGLAVIRERMDQRVRSPEDIAAVLGLPVIGAIPHMKRALTPLARAQAVHWDPMSEVAEAYRAVRTAIHFGVPNGHARTIAITSPTPSDGKSTLASNLAITMAQAGKRTLLLDADFRRPVQHKMFEVKDDQGLTTVLAGQETLATVIQRTVVEGLDILPSGPLPLNPSELLNGESFAAIVEELTQKYDHVLLDCPPVMAVTDARILGALCDISILVLRCGKTSRRGAELRARGC